MSIEQTHNSGSESAGINKIHQPSQLSPLAAHTALTSPMALAAAEYSEMVEVSLQETQEELSLILGTRLQDERIDKNKQRQVHNQKLLLKLIQQIKESGKAEIFDNKPRFGEDNGAAYHLFELFKTEGVLSQLEEQEGAKNRRRLLSQKMAELMQIEGWQIDLFGIVELGWLRGQHLAPIKKLFQQSLESTEMEESAIGDWFERIRHWPDRKKRLRILLQAFAFDLMAQPPARTGARISAIIYQLRRLLLFFTLEDYCQQIARSFALSGEQILAEVIAIVSQSWLLNSWFKARLLALTALQSAQWPHFCTRLLELLRLMPPACFQDSDHCEQISAVLLEFVDDNEKYHGMQ